MPQFKSPKIPTSFAHTTASTTDATNRGIQRNAAFNTCAISPTPIKVKQKAVLGAIGIYLAPTLASSGTPEIQPMNVSRPNAIVSDAQVNGIIRKLRLSLRSSAAPLVCRNTGICPRLARLLVLCKTHSTGLWWTIHIYGRRIVRNRAVRAKLEWRKEI
jgi:hypothetical protein